MNNNGRIVYYCEAMKFFGEHMIQHHGYRRYNSETDIDKPVFFEGLYFPDDYRVFLRHRGERIVFWNGTDISNLLLSYGWQLIMEENPAKHYCGHVKDKEKLAKAGVTATVHPLFFGDTGKYPVSYQQSDVPQLYLNTHPEREVEYGISLALEIAKEMPEVRFHIYGISGENTNNIFYHGWIDESIMDDEIKYFQGCFMPYGYPDHLEGIWISQTCLKSAFMAQYPISVFPIPGLWSSTKVSDIINFARMIKDQKEPNYILREQYLKIYENQWGSI